MAEKETQEADGQLTDQEPLPQAQESDLTCTQVCRKYKPPSRDTTSKAKAIELQNNESQGQRYTP